MEPRLAVSDLSEKVWRGGVSVDFVMIVEEELDRYSLTCRPIMIPVGVWGVPAFRLGHRGPEQHFLPPIFRVNGAPGNSSANPTPAPTWPQCRHVLSAMAMTMFIMARRSISAAAWLRDDVDYRGHRSDRPRHENLGWLMILWSAGHHGHAYGTADAGVRAGPHQGSNIRCSLTACVYRPLI